VENIFGIAQMPRLFYFFLMAELDRDELTALANRLAVVYKGATRIEELVRPGLSTTAHNLIAKDPKKYARIASDLLDGESTVAIARKEHVPPSLVMFIRQQHPELVHAGRANLISNLEEASIAMTRRLIDEGDEIRIDKVPHALALTLDKLAVLTGGVTSRTEHVSAPKPEEVRAMFDALPKARVQQD
jgi:hypothetical protein